jgi:YHS domain-containing protein
MRLLFPVLLFLIVYYFIRYLLRGLMPGPANPSQVRNSGDPAATSTRERIVRQGRMEKDPVCGTYVDVATSVQATFAGETRYFCSSECLNKYKKTH